MSAHLFIVDITAMLLQIINTARVHLFIVSVSKFAKVSKLKKLKLKLKYIGRFCN
jgi:hypothetical protein